METTDYLGMFCIVLYIITDVMKDKDLLKNKKLMFLAVFNGIFLTGVLFVILTNYIDLLDYWWMLILLGLPTSYYQYLRIKRSKNPGFIKFSNTIIMIAFMIIVLLKVL